MARLFPLALAAVVLLPAPPSPAQTAPVKPRLTLDAGGHTGPINHLLFTADGKRLISVSTDKTACVWEVDTGRLARVFRPPTGGTPPFEFLSGRLVAAALSPDETTLAVGGFHSAESIDSPIYLISLATGSVTKTLKGEATLQINTLAFSPDGKTLVSGGEDHKLRLWNVAKGSCERTLTGHTGEVTGVSFSPDGQKFATSSLDGTARVWSVANGKQETVLKGHVGAVYSVFWHPRGVSILTSGHDGSLRAFTPSGTSIKVIDRLGSPVTAFARFPDGDRFLIAHSGRTSDPAAVIKFTTGKEVVRFKRSVAPAQKVTAALSPDGTRAATTSDPNFGIDLWDTATGTHLFRLGGAGRRTFAAGWNKDGTAIAWGNTPANGAAVPRLERAFSIPDLTETAAPDATFRREVTERDGIRLVRDSDGSKVSVFVNGKKVSDVPAPFAAGGDRITAVTLLSGKTFAAATTIAVFVFEVGKPDFVAVGLGGHGGSITGIVPSPDGRFLLTTSEDQTSCVWALRMDKAARQEKVQPLLSLFFSGSQWVAATPDGYYATSAGGEDLAGWFVENGSDRTPTFYGMAQFRKTFYRPDVIRLLLKTGSVELALSEADKARGGPPPTRRTRESVATSLPPKVLITSPSGPILATKDEKLEVQFVATSVEKAAITRARLFVNGRPYSGAGGEKVYAPAKVGEVRDSWTVSLLPGENEIEVRVDGEASEGVSPPVTVTLQADAKQPGGTTDRRIRLQKLHVLAIGVSDYADKGLRLASPRKDATAFAEAIRKHAKGLYGDVTVRTLLDRDATRANILREFETLRKAAGPLDSCAVFFAGHGVEEQGRYYFLPADTVRNREAESGISSAELIRALDKPRDAMLFLDTCHSGAAIGAGRRSRISPDLVGELTRDHGISMLCAAMPQQQAGGDDDSGIFTQAVVEGLAGRAKQPDTGVVTSRTLFEFANERVRDLDKTNQQHPMLCTPRGARPFSLTKP